MSRKERKGTARGVYNVEHWGEQSKYSLRKKILTGLRMKCRMKWSSRKGGTRKSTLQKKGQKMEEEKVTCCKERSYDVLYIASTLWMSSDRITII